MTPEQLERAARHYCKLIGVDPDAMVLDKAHDGLTPPLWKEFSDQLLRHWAMNEALEEGMRDDEKYPEPGPYFGY